jgi:HlyD family secretion protein
MTPRMIALSLGGAALAGVLAFIAFRPEPVLVDLAPVTRGTLSVTIPADGRTRIRDVWEVASPIAGTAQRSPVAVGDKVVAGETVVAVVEPVVPALLDARTRAEAEAALRQAEAALAVAEAQLAEAEEERNYAQTQRDRAQALVERGVASMTRLEDAEQMLHAAETAVAAAQSSRAMQASARDRTAAALIEEDAPGTWRAVEIRAPASGVVLALGAESERPVLPGAALVSIGDPADLEIVADLLSSDAVRLPPGAPATAERWGGPPLTARLISVEPVARTEVSALGIEEQRVNAVFDILTPLQNREALGHNFAVFLRITVWQADDVLQVPVSAVFREGDGWAVFRVADGIAERAAVTLGQRGESGVEVIDGLAEGDRVVTHPPEALLPGGKVAERS